jgi:hypothetical protein
MKRHSLALIVTIFFIAASSLAAGAPAAREEGWIGGVFGVLAQRSGGQWRAVITPATEQINAIALSDAAHGWAVGTSGLILRIGSVPPAPRAFLPLLAR